MASAFELLEAYVTISERGAAQTINRIRQVEAAAISASQRNIVIGISTSLDNALAQLNRVTNVLNQIAIDARSLSFTQTNNTLNQTVSLTQRVVNNTNNITNNIQRASSASGGLNNVVSLLSQATLGYLSLDTAIRAVSASFNESFGRERSFVTFSRLLQDGERARTLLIELEQLARETPFDFAGLRDTAQSLLALGSSADTVVGEIRRISEVAAGSNAELSRVVRAYTQIRTNSRVLGEELNQLGDAGVPILDELAKNLGTTAGNVRKLASEGKVGFDALENAFRTLTSEGGRFAGILTDLADTTPSLFTRLKDEALGLGSDLAGLSTGELNESLKNSIEATRQLRDLNKESVRVSQEVSREYSLISNYLRGSTPIGSLGQAFRIANSAVTPIRENIEAQRELQAAYDETYKAISEADSAAITALERRDLAARETIKRWSGVKAAVEDATKALESDRRLAEKITQSVLTPYEQLEQKLEEIRRLQTRSLITPEIGTRAIKAANEEYRKLSETFNELSDSWQKVIDEFNSDPNVTAAERIRDSILTPLEEFEAKIREIGELQQKGFLGDDTSNRAITKAIEDYDKLLRRQEKLAKNVERTSFTVGTDQEFKFRIEQSTEQRRAAQAAEEQTRLQRTANGLLQDIRTELDELNNRPEVTEQTFDTSEIF